MGLFKILLKRIIWISLFIFCISGTVFQANATLSGSYTIDPGSAASGSNYKDIGSAISDMVSGTRSDGGTANGSGVGGAVTFSIANGTYTGPFSLSSISGVSSSNTITFQSASGDSSKVILTTASSSSSTNNFTLQLNGADWVIFKQITIQRSGTSTYGVVLDIRNASNNNKFTGCKLYGIVGSTNSSNYNHTVVYSGQDQDTGNIFQGNLIRNGNYGVYIYGTSSYESGNQFLNNTVDSFYVNGINPDHNSNCIIAGNKITGRSNAYGNASGIYLYYCNGSFKATKNIINLTSGGYGMTMYYSTGTSSVYVLIANNFIIVSGTYAGYGIYTNNCSYQNFYYNSISVTSSSTSYGLYLYYQYYSNIENNILVNSSYGYGYYLYPAYYTYSSDYNDVYTGAGSATAYNWDGSSYSTPSSLHSSYTSQEGSSISKDPFFKSATDLHVADVLLNGAATPLSSVKDDIDGTTRNVSTPDIGADEFTPTANDAGILGIDSITQRFCPGSQKIYAVLTNNGANTLTKVTINWKVNGTAQSAYSWTGSLSPGASVDAAIGSYTFAPATTYIFKVYSSSPNTGTDGYAINDTFNYSKTVTALNGSYTIDPAGSGSYNYTSFTNAASDLNSYGVCGAVTFNVADGNYTQQMSLGSITGTSASSTVLFKSKNNDSSKVILTYASSSSSTNNYTLQLNGADWVTVKKITVQRTGASTYGTVIDIRNGSNNNVLLNNRFSGIKNTTTATTDQTVIYSGQDNDTNILFQNCLIRGGSYAVYMQGASSGSHESGIQFLNNTVDSFYEHGIYLYESNNATINSNTITGRSNASTGAAGIFVNDCDGRLRVFKNYVVMNNGGNGIWAGYCDGSSTVPGIIANNFFSIAGSSTAYGIYATNYSTYQNFYYNSVNITNTNSSCFAGYFYYQYYSNFENNIFANKGGGYANYVYPVSYISSSDYNDVYSSGGYLYDWDNSSYSSVANLHSSYTSKEGSSVSADPFYTSNTDLHVDNVLLNNVATPISGIKDDIDGQTRSVSTPDIGADEFTPATNDAGITGLDSMTQRFCPGAQKIYAVMTNNGYNTLTKVNINWKVNGTAQTVYSWTGSLSPGASVDVNIGTYTFSPSTAYTFKVYTSSPNGTTDGYVLNDTFNYAKTLTTLNGSYTINPSGSGSYNYTSFTNAASDLNSYGICGAVVFTIADGTYTQQVSLNQITGSSAANTIVFKSKSNDSSKVIITSASSSSASNNYILELNGADWVTVKEITLQRTGTSTYGTVVYIHNGANNNVFLNDKIYGIKNTTATGYEQTAIYSGSDNDTNILFQNCLIRGGSYGVYMQGASSSSHESGIQFINNIVDSFYTNGINLYESNNAIITGNMITGRSNSATNAAGLYFNDCDGRLRVLKNIIIMNNGGFGFWGGYCDGSSTSPAIIANNFFSIGGSSSSYGIYGTNYSTYQNFYYNSVNITNTNSSCVAGYFYYQYYSNFENNIFANKGGGYAYYVYPVSYISSSDYNDVYSSGGYPYDWDNSTYGSVASVHSSYSGKEGSSVSVDPFYNSSTDLHVSNVVLNNVATPLSGIKDDIDGQSRSISTPDIGADEFTPATNDAGVLGLDSLLIHFCPGSQKVYAIITNNGYNTLTKATINWKVNGTAQTAYSWTGSLSPGASTDVNIGSYTYIGATAYTIKVYTSSPNGTTDGYVLNDTFNYSKTLTALNGSYTIDPAGSGSYNYTSFTSAASDLNNYGICGAVVFNVADGTYTQQVSLNQITGSSAANNIVFQSKSYDSSKVIVTNASSSSGTNNYILELNGTDWVTVKEITMQRTGTSTYGTVVYIHNGADNNIFLNNKFYGIKNTTSTGYEQTVVYSGSDNDTNILFQNCLIRGGSYGVYMQGASSGSHESGIQFINNIVDSFYTNGINLYESNNAIITGNMITGRSNSATNAAGLYFNDCDGRLRVLKNIVIMNNGGFGFWGGYCDGSSTSPANIANNFFSIGGSSSSYGIYGTNYSTYQNFYYNSVNITNTNSGCVAAYFYYQYYSNFENNIFANKSGGYAYYVYPVSYISSSDYNDIYSTGYMYDWDNSTYGSVAAVHSSYTTKEGSSISTDPYFYSSTDLHIGNALLNGKATPITGIKDDIDGQTRDVSTPDIGADEYTPANNDAGILTMDSTVRSFCPGTQPIYARLINYGANAITSVTINWKVNGYTQPAYSWTGSLSSGGTTVVNVGSLIFNGSSTNNFTFYTSNPNGTTDAKTSNDTFRTSGSVSALSGTYTIGGTSPNYSTFSAAVTALNTYGLCGAVTFNVRSGTYPEQISINQISGSSAANKITFQSQLNDSTAVTLTYPSSSSSASNYVLQLNGADWVTVKKITIQRTGSSSYGVVVDIRNGSNNNKFLNNRIKGIKGSTSTSDDQTVIFSANNQDTGNVFKYNNIKYGGTGMGLYGSSSGYDYGYDIENNQIDSPYYSGMNLQYVYRPLIKNNVVSMNSGSYSAAYGISFNYCYYMSILKNIVIQPNGGTAIYLYESNGSSTFPILIANNFCSVSSNNSSNGIYSYYGNYVNCYYNNTLLTGTGSSYGGAFYYSSNTNVENNNFINTGGGYTYYVYPFSGYISSSDYNNYYTSGSYLANINGSSYSTLSNLKSATSKDANSLNVNPKYVSTSDLHVTNVAIDGKATPLTSVIDDIDGDARSTTVPDIGADEFDPPKYDISVGSFINPSMGYCSGAQNIQVTIKNNGNTPITSATISWTVNGTAQTPFNWTGSSIAKGATSPAIAIGTYTFTAATNYSFKAYTSLPNGKNDTDKTNDTAYFSGKSGLTGSYTIGGVTPDYSTFSASVTALKTRGVCGTVTFNVRDGIYTEQVSLDSTINTSNAKTVTYQSSSKDSSKVTLTYASSSSPANNYTLLMNGADHFIFNKIGFARSGTNTYGRVVDIHGGAYGNKFTDDKIVGNKSAGSSDQQALVYSGGDVDSTNYFSNNLLKYGSYGFDLNGAASNNIESNNIITGNTIDSTNYVAVFEGYESSLTISSNTITNLRNTGATGIYLYTCFNQGISVIKNKINMPNSGTGIYQYSYSYNTTTPSVIANNMISIGGSNTSYGIYSTYTDMANIYYNSIYISSSDNSSFAGYFEGYGYGLSVNVNDNIFENAGGNMAMYVPYSGYMSNSDYNDYFAPGHSIVNWNGTNYSTLASLQSASGTDANSRNINPFFNSSSDLHANNGALKAGTPVTGITDDIDGQTRSVTKPDMGADEFTPASLDAGIQNISSPGTPICFGTKNVLVDLGNYGSTTITKANVNWTVNGTAQTVYKWTGSLALGAVATSVNIGSYAFSAGTSYTIKAWTTSPNGGIDGFNGNDTTTITVVVNSAPAANVGSAASICNGTGTSIGASSVSGDTYSWTSNPSGFTSTNSNPSVSPSVTTTYYLTETITATGCSKSDSVKITVKPIPSTPVASNNGPLCKGATLNLKASTVSGASYTWTGANTFSSSSQNPSKTGVTTADTGVYSVTATISGCTSPAGTTTFHLSPSPAPSISGNTAVCASSSSSYSTTNNSGSTYKWTISGATIASGSGTSSISVSFGSSTGTVSLKVVETNSGGCKDSSSISINVLSKPTPNVGSAQTICNGNSASIGGTSTSGHTYSWTSNPSGFTSTSSNPSVSPSVTTTYKLTETITSGGCSASDSVKITVTPVPSAPTASSNSPICAGQTLNLKASNVTGGTFSWTGPSSYSSSSQNPNITGTATSNSGSYSVTVTVSGCTSTAASTSVTVNARPTPSASGSTTVCANSSTSYSTTNNSGSTYAWTISGGSITSGASASTANVTWGSGSSGSLKVVETNSSGCKDSSTVSITINPLPSATVGSATTICNGNSASIGASSTSGHTYSWTSNPSGYTSSSSNPTVSPSSTTTYKLTETITSSGCTKSDSVKITVNPLPSASTSSATSICSGNSTSIGAASTSGHTYNWTSNPSGYTSTSSNPSVNPTVTTTYILTEKITATGCSKTDSVTITVNPLPSATVTSATGICSGASLSLGAASTSGHTYSWTSNPSGFTSSISNPKDSPGVTTTFYLKETITATGCSKTDSVKITVSTRPSTPSASNNGSLCEGDALSLKTPTLSGATYSWTGPNSFTSSSQNPTKSSVTIADSGIYYVTVSLVAGCASSAGSTSLTVYRKPSASISGNASVCTGSTLSYSAGSTGNVYSWKVSGGTINSGAGTNKISVTWGSAGTGSVKLVEQNSNSCKDSTTTSITINSLPVANAGSNQTVCSGSSASIGAKAVTGSTYSWTSNPTGFTSTSSSAIVNPTVNTTYYLTETVTASGCSKIDSVTITANPLPLASTGSSTSICSGNSIVLGASSTSGHTYSWTSSPSGYTSTNSSPKVSPSVTTTYYLTETITATGCFKSDSVVITVNPVPSASTGSATSICSGNSTSIGATSVSGSTYSWTSNPSGFTSTSSNPSVSPATTTVYTLTETITATGCSKTDSVKITVNPLPSATVASSTSICNGSSISIGATSTSGDTYSWTSKPSGYTSTSSNPSVIPSANTTYYLTETVTATGCKKSDSTTITVNPTPSATTGSATAICKGDSVQIGGSSTSGNTYSWTSNPPGFTSTSNNPIVKPSSTTNYKLTETITATGCSKSDSVKITVNPLPAPSLGKAVAVCANSSATYSTTKNSGSSYNWSITGGSITSGSGTNSVKVTWGSTGTGYIQVVETNGSGCKDSTIDTITINPLPAAAAGSSATICNGSTAIIGSTAVSGDTYKWISKPSGYTSTTSTDTISPSVSRVYYLTETVSATGCSNSDSITITVNPSPKPSAGTASKICLGDSVKIGMTANAGNTYSWTSNPSGFASTASNPIVRPTATTMYYITETNSSSCSKTDSVLITLNPSPITSFDFDGTCLGQTTILSDSTKISGSSISAWAWDFGDGFKNKSQNPKHSYAKTGTYTVHLVTTAADGCKDSATSVLTVYPAIDPKFTWANTGGRNIQFTPNDSTAASYNWDFGDGSIANSIKPLYTYGADGKYNVVLIVSNGKGCSAKDSDSVLVKLTGINEVTADNFKCIVYPNPFKEQVILDYDLAKSSHIKITVYAMDGREISTLTDTKQDAGNYKIRFAPTDNITQGIYILKMQIDDRIITKQLLRVK